jgi:hypothetical protein
MRGLLRHLTPANVLSTALLVAVLGVGSALAGGNANEVGGWNTKSFSYSAPENTGGGPILNVGDLKLVPECHSGASLVWEADTTKDQGSYYSYGYNGDDFQGDFDQSDTISLSTGGERDAVFSNPDGHIVVLQYFSFDSTGAGSTCRVAGLAFWR